MLQVRKTEVQKVFNGHIFAESWESASSAKQDKVLAHATRDISTLNYSKDTPHSKLAAAVAEQILLLLSLNNSDVERIKAQATGVKQRGVEGASEWYYDEKPGKVISPDAIAALDGYVHRRFGRLR